MGMDTHECSEAGEKHVEDKRKVADESNTESSQQRWGGQWTGWISVEWGEDKKNEMELNAEISQLDVPPSYLHKLHQHLAHAAAAANSDATKTKLEQEVLDEWQAVEW